MFLSCEMEKLFNDEIAYTYLLLNRKVNIIFPYNRRLFTFETVILFKGIRKLKAFFLLMPQYELISCTIDQCKAYVKIFLPRRSQFMAHTLLEQLFLLHVM